jgi:addiction module RelE/StbE family toxin
VARLIWTNQALEDFEALLDYISHDAPIAARRFGQKLIDKVELLQANPLLGSFLQEDDTKTYREILQGSYRLIYRVEGDIVYLITIHHAARLLSSLKLEER